MEIRKVQKTGDMNYLYLPTLWCKGNSIVGGSTVGLSKGSDGSLIITPHMQKKKTKHVELNISGNSPEIINKIIMACYINPADSFKINLEKPMDYRALLDQKRLISVELVEMEDKGKTITCESSVVAGDPDMLLRTMINKVNNMLLVMTKNSDKDLIQKYEEEIDRNRIMIDKAVISSMAYKMESKLKTVDLFYISLISKDIERLVDHTILLDDSDRRFLEETLEIIRSLKDVVDIATDPKKNLDYHTAIRFAEKVMTLKEEKMKDIKSYYKLVIRQYLTNISEVLIDWAVTNEAS